MDFHVTAAQVLKTPFKKNIEFAVRRDSINRKKKMLTALRIRLAAATTRPNNYNSNCSRSFSAPLSRPSRARYLRVAEISI